MYAPSFPTLSDHRLSHSYREMLRSHFLLFGFFISVSVSGSPRVFFSQMEVIIPTNGRFLSDSPSPNWLFASQTR
ncbi:hypothetical protein BDR06DRAFT_959005, partial [Suillus hirtellus]